MVLQKVILNDKWLQTLQYYVRFRRVLNPFVKAMYMHMYTYTDTGLLEVYHNTILAYAPKRLSFR